jgi:ubiquinone/menaquinone biosynthesis C-methylase UbiE
VTSTQQEWRSDFFGGLNQMPPEPVGLIAQVLEAMATEPAFHTARRALFRDLGLGPGSRVLEGGCGTGAALPDLLETVGASGRIVGTDVTEAFLAQARERAGRLGAKNAEYLSADVRALPQEDGAFDAAFCDKVLLHVGPPRAVLGELVRVTRPGGRVGALEWQPHFTLSTTRPELEAKFNGVFRAAVCDFQACPNLGRYLREAGLRDVVTRAYLAHAHSLDEHPFWRRFLVDHVPLFVHAGLLAEEDGQALVRDLEDLDRKGAFFASFVIRTAVGTRPGE